ncbi:MAG: type II secretion system F [Candidatus Ozemobacter sibiricus]|uniref:Type II secretion system F n=1 Tax=Candidatus Ozemobacter sibiricus TaxID=2268124 RepID=A0A367ZRL0_9BACT|nr:MAG: type II secretion system F [Candidatus Ozemobacter sibiricus]
MSQIMNATPSLAGPAEDVLVFAQILHAASGSGLPLSRFLEEAAAALPPARAADWAKQLGEGLAKGHPPAEILAGLEGIDQALVALLSVPGGLGLRDALAAYIRHLVGFARLREHLRAALFQPFLVAWLAVGNLVLVNLHFLPAISGGFLEQRLPLPIFLRAWYILEPATWPLSWILPAGLVWLAVELTRLLYVMAPPRLMTSPLAGPLGLDHFCRLEEKGRLIGLLSLYLGAGRPLAQALRWTAAHGGARLYAHDLTAAAARLERGEAAAAALADSAVLGAVAGELALGNPDGRLDERLQELSESYQEAANRQLAVIEGLGRVAGLLLAGTVVLLLCLAFFQPYFTYAGQTAVAGG